MALEVLTQLVERAMVVLSVDPSAEPPSKLAEMILQDLDLIAAVSLGIVTPGEAANVLLAHVETRTQPDAASRRYLLAEQHELNDEVAAWFSAQSKALDAADE